jgi:hypothetical protein
MSEDQGSNVPEEYLKNVRRVRPVLVASLVVGSGLVAGALEAAGAFLRVDPGNSLGCDGFPQSLKR